MREIRQIRLVTVHVHATKEGSFAIAPPMITAEEYRTGHREVEDVDFETVVSEFESRPDLYTGDGIHLASCHAASTGLAAHLARRLHTWILAPTHDIVSAIRFATDTFIPANAILWTVTGEEVHYFHPDDVAEGAHWVLFDPEGEWRAKVYPNEAENSILFALGVARLKAQYATA